MSVLHAHSEAPQHLETALDTCSGPLAFSWLRFWRLAPKHGRGCPVWQLPKTEHEPYRSTSAQGCHTRLCPTRAPVFANPQILCRKRKRVLVNVSDELQVLADFYTCLSSEFWTVASISIRMCATAARQWQCFYHVGMVMYRRIATALAPKPGSSY